MGIVATVRRRGGLSMVLLQLKDPFELFVKRREFLPGSVFLSGRDMNLAVESDVNPTPSFLPCVGQPSFEKICFKLVFS